MKIENVSNTNRNVVGNEIMRTKQRNQESLMRKDTGVKGEVRGSLVVLTPAYRQVNPGSNISLTNRRDSSLIMTMRINGEVLRIYTYACRLSEESQLRYFQHSPIKWEMIKVKRKCDDIMMRKWLKRIYRKNIRENVRCFL